jgi:hypothetical protein
MKLHYLLALYGGPDQIMGVTSALATIAGLALVFWNKMLAFFAKIINKFHPHPSLKDAPKETPVRDESL